MGRKAGITLDDVAVVATTIADRDGLEAATLTAVASELGIKTPSLYNHVNGLAGLKRLLAMHGAQLLLHEFETAVFQKVGAEALQAVAEADRAFATIHPGLFESFLPAPRPGEDDELYEAMAQPVYLVAGILLNMGIPQEEAIHLIRAMWALLHGFLDLEAKGGFGIPVEIDASFDASMELMISGIELAATNAQTRAAT
jgi:AcrR family transcriptional regulator